MNVSMKYSYIIKTLLMTFFFAPIFPLGFGISFTGFIFGYWIEKYNLSKMYKKPEKLDKQIAEFYVNFFFSIFTFFFQGSFCFLYFDSYKLIFVELLIFLCIFLITHFRKCFYRDYFGFKESEIHKKTYD